MELKRCATSLNHLTKEKDFSQQTDSSSPHILSEGYTMYVSITELDLTIYIIWIRDLDPQ